MFRNFEEYKANAMFDVNCKKHGHSLSLSGDCEKCLEELDRDNQNYPHGLCAGCAFADAENSNNEKTLCYAWSVKGFPVRPRKRRCKRRKTEVEIGFDYE